MACLSRAQKILQLSLQLSTTSNKSSDNTLNIDTPILNLGLTGNLKRGLNTDEVQVEAKKLRTVKRGQQGS
jgi:hypothetical protein